MTKAQSTTRIKERRILEALRDSAVEIMKIDRFYTVLYDRKQVMLYFPVVAQWSNGQLKPVTELWPARPYRPDIWLPDCLFITEESVFINNEKDFVSWMEECESEPERPLPSSWIISDVSIDDAGLKLKYESDPHGFWETDPLPVSWMSVPLIARGRVLGVIVMEYMQEGAYDKRSLEFLAAMANRAASALANSRLVESLRVVNQVGQVLTSKVRLSKDGILTLIYEQAGKLMNTRDMYIALYNHDTQMLSFPFAVMDGKRQCWPSRHVDLTKGEIKGLTEEVLINKQPLCPSDVKAWFQAKKIEPKVEPVPKSWVGVPLLREKNVMGIISLQNDEVSHLYGEGDIQILQTLAGQAAIALENARLYENLEERVRERTMQLEEAQQKIADQEAVVTRTMISTDFVHRLNNLAGTIPIWAGQIREHLEAEGVQDEILDVYLTNIEADTEELLRAAEQLKSLPEAQSVNIDEILQALVRQARIQTSSKIDIRMESKDKLPFVRAVAMELRNALWSVMENGIDAMPDGGVLLVTAQSSVDAEDSACINIKVRDEGIGIPQGIADKIFSPFYSTKEGHMGYGLWRARNIFERMGGTISFEIIEGDGTIFVIRLPASEEVSRDV